MAVNHLQTPYTLPHTSPIQKGQQKDPFCVLLGLWCCISLPRHGALWGGALRLRLGNWRLRAYGKRIGCARRTPSSCSSFLGVSPLAVKAVPHNPVQIIIGFGLRFDGCDLHLAFPLHFPNACPRLSIPALTERTECCHRAPNSAKFQTCVTRYENPWQGFASYLQQGES